MGYAQSDLARFLNGLGQEVKALELNGTNNRQVEIEHFAPGVYFLVDANGGHFIQKILVGN